MISYSFGPSHRGGETEFRLWAPLQTDVMLHIAGEADRPMQRGADGWHRITVDDVAPGARYGFRLEDGRIVADPASRRQPDGPHGLSEIVDLDAFRWQAADWRGRPWAETVVYELHVGAFTPEGTFAAAIDRLDHLAGLGVTALQLMPLNEFPGRRGWGYDGVLPYAPFRPYGRPEDLQRLIDAAHTRGLSVFVDAVYNHLGPDGNALPSYAPIFTKRHNSPWGAGINLDGKDCGPVRDYFIENALYWLDRFRFDGIRFDAVHALKDDSEPHFLAEMAGRIRAAFPGRHIHLIVENEENDSGLLERAEDGTPRLYTAQWNDDVHHVLHAAATGEDFSYYADYAGDSGKTARALAEGFAFQGEVMAHRGSERGKPSAHLPPTAFIAFIQNHDQVGNRALGDRLTESTTPAQRRALAALYLLLPQIPMIFMGEEWDSHRPFPYFCDFNDELNRVVRAGRREELSHLPGFDEASNTMLDPTTEETFLRAKLDWEALSRPDPAGHLDLYRTLLTLRRRVILPLLPGLTRAGHWRVADGCIAVEWKTADGRRLCLLANPGDRPAGHATALEGEILWREGEIDDTTCGPWSVVWRLFSP